MIKLKNITQACLLTLLFLVAVVPYTQAQTVATPYYCGSYWSSYPCGNSYTFGYQYWYPNYSNYSNYWYYQPTYSYPYTNYQYLPPTPSCTITASSVYGNNYYYGYAGYGAVWPITLSWYSANATSAYISNIGSVPTYGSTTVYPYGTMTYTMTVYGPGGATTCQTAYYQPVQNYYPHQHHN